MNTTTKWHTEPATDAQKHMLLKIAAKKVSGEGLVAYAVRINEAVKGDVDMLKNEIFQLPWPKKVAEVALTAPAKSVELWEDVADGNYAYAYNGKTHFYRITRVEGKGKWAGRTFINVQERASDELFKIYDYKLKVAILTTIRTNGPEICGKLFAEKLGKCYRCGKTLTDDDNPYKSQGLGPDCGTKI